MTAVEDQVDQVEAKVAGGGLVERDDQGRRSGGFTPWLLLAPGIIFLLLFFFIPLYTLFQMSLSERTDRFSDPTFNWHWENYGDAFSQFGEQFYRSFFYASIATILALLIGYPLAYVIAFRGGRFTQRAARPRGGAVLHELPDPYARVEDHPRQRGLGRQCAARPRESWERTRACCARRGR